MLVLRLISGTIQIGPGKSSRSRLTISRSRLISVIRLKIAARTLGIAAIDFSSGELVLTAAEATRIDPQRLVNLLTKASGGVRVTPGHKIYSPVPDPSPKGIYKAARRLLDHLSGSVG